MWHEGWMGITVEMENMVFGDDMLADSDIQQFSGQILEGSRNNTMSHFAGRIVKKYGVCKRAREDTQYLRNLYQELLMEHKF